MTDKITLDRETFKVLAADTRIDILKMLAEHKLTLTDIAEKTKMSPSTIKEHLDRLVEAGLIIADDKGMKWKYYRLTDKGRNIVTPQETKVWILLGTTILILAGSLISVFWSMSGMMSQATYAAAPLSLETAAAPANDEGAGQARLMGKATPQEAEQPGLLMSQGAPEGKESGEAASEETTTTEMAAPPQPQPAYEAPDVSLIYVEMAVAGLSLIVIGVCTGILLKNRMR